MSHKQAEHNVGVDVSRETYGLLTRYHDLILKWQATINLVARSTLSDIWVRHIQDSAQLWALAPLSNKTWLDLGSGGGLPGIVVAILAREFNPDLKVTLVESDIRKCGFLREAARQLELNVAVFSRRIEEVPRQSADTISARALTDLNALISLAAPHMAPNATLLFPKGATYQTELATIDQIWRDRLEIIPSQTQPDAVILRFTVNA